MKCRRKSWKSTRSVWYQSLPSRMGASNLFIGFYIPWGNTPYTIPSGRRPDEGAVGKCVSCRMNFPTLTFGWSPPNFSFMGMSKSSSFTSTNYLPIRKRRPSISGSIHPSSINQGSSQWINPWLKKRQVTKSAQSSTKISELRSIHHRSTATGWKPGNSIRASESKFPLRLLQKTKWGYWSLQRSYQSYRES